MNVVLDRGGIVAIEWPKYNMYWKEPVVQDFICKHDFSVVDFDGCMFGLVSHHGKQAGVPIRKPWRIATNSVALRKALSLTCDGRHQHAACQGKDTKVTQAYTDPLVQTIHAAFARHCGQ